MFAGKIDSLLDKPSEPFVDRYAILYLLLKGLDDGVLDLYADPISTFRAFSDLVGTLDGQGYSIRINAESASTRATK